MLVGVNRSGEGALPHWGWELALAAESHVVLNAHGYPILAYTGASGGVKKPRRWLPKREAWYCVEWKDKWYYLHWKPRQGLWWRSVMPKGDYDVAKMKSFPRPEVRSMKRRSVAADGLPVVPAIGMASTILAKLPHLREFLTATAYDDGTARRPGYLWLSNKGSVLEVVLFDPDACARMPVTAVTFDDVLLAAEKLLGVEEAPWQQDSYLAERMAKKRTRKGA